MFYLKFILSVIVAWAISILQLSWKVWGDNLIYAIGEIGKYDNTLFNHNVYMGDGVVSPRYITDFLFAVMMKINGGNWGGAELVYTYFASIVQAFAIACLAYRISKSAQPIYSALIAYLILYNDNRLAGFRLAVLGSSSIGPALAFACLAISFVIGDKKNYKMAWIFTGCAAIWHIHEGIYCFAVVFIIAVVDCLIQKKMLIKENVFILLAFAAILLVSLPSLITDRLNITDSQFVEIYAIYRAPHHLVPSRWGGMGTILRSLWINVSLMLLTIEVIYLTDKNKIKRFVLEGALFVLAWIGAVCMAYVFTEIKPVATVSTLFLSKFFKYVVLISLLWALYAVRYARENGKMFSGYLILFFACLNRNWSFEQLLLYFLVCAVLVFLEFTHSTVLFSKRMVFVLDILFCGFLMPSQINMVGSTNFKRIIIVFACLAILFLFETYRSKYYSIVFAVCGLIMIIGSAYGRLYLVSDGKITLQSGKSTLIATMGKDLYDLAETFEDQTEASEEFLADPDDDDRAGWFQLVCKRNCYVVYTIVPSAKCTMLDWYQRYKSIENFSNKSVDEIMEVMRDANIKYVLVRADNYEKFDASIAYKVFATCTDDTYRIYSME